MIQKRLFSALAVLTLAASCLAAGTADRAGFLRQHCLYVRKGKLESRSWTPAQILSAYSLQAAGQPLVIHFHGGLVSAPTAEQEAVDLYNKSYSGAGYPVYFVWNADFWSQLNNVLETQYHNTAFLQGHVSTAQFLEYIYGRMRTTGQDWTKSFQSSDMLTAYRRYMNADPSFQSALRKQAFEQVKGEVVSAGSQLSDWTKLETWSKAKDNLQRRVTDYFSPYVGGVTANHDARSVSWSGDFLEWVAANMGGKDVWQRMKADTSDAFAIRHGTYGAGLRFLYALAQMNPRPPRIVLVGHSTGCIYAMNFMRAAHAIMPETQFDVIFMAPANTYRETASFLMTCPGAIHNFRMFAMRDQSEKKDHMLWEINPQLEGLYPGSLLTFVSRAVEARHNMPLIGLERDYSVPILNPDRAYSLIVHENLLDRPGNVVWTPSSGGPGYASACLCHGNFCSDVPTLTSLRYLVGSENW